MKRILLVGLWLLVLAASTNISAHEIRPGCLEVRQTEVDTYNITWRVPGRGDGRLLIHALLPENCTETSPIRYSRVPGAFIDQWTSWDEKLHGVIAQRLRDEQKYRYRLVTYEVLGESAAAVAH